VWGNGWEGKGKGGGLTPLLLVGDESEADEADEGAREDKVGGGGVVAGHTGGEEDDVGWYGDGEEEDLRGGREVRKLFCARGGGWGGGGGMVLTLWAREMKTTLKTKKGAGLMYCRRMAHR